MRKPISLKNHDNFSQLRDLISRLILEQEKKAKESDGTLNLFDLNNISHLENYHSNIIAYLIDDKEAHNHEEFGREFFQFINKKYSEKQIIPSYIKIIKVVREKTIEGGRIDIVIETDSFVLIIENKIIYAPDGERQLNKYYDWGKKEFQGKKKVILCYLTLYGSPPAVESLPTDMRNELLKDGKYVELSYEKDILDWLESLKVRVNENILQSALIQYIDLLKGLCELREENIMGFKLVLENMKKMCSNASHSEIKQIAKNAILIQRSCQYYLYLQFITKLVESLSKKLKAEGGLPNKIFYTHQQNRFAINDRARWEVAVENNPKNIGVEIFLSPYVGIGIELDAISDNPKLYYGIMLHGKEEHNSYHLEEEWDTNGFSIIKTSDEWWKEYSFINYIIKSMFRELNFEDSLVDDMSYWLINTWKYNQKNS
jgi:hypothetical protein